MGRLQELGKSTIKDTALYGISSIVGRFLNYMLVPLYTHTMTASSGNYGIVTNIYAWTALLLVVLTFGFETTFMRFAGRYPDNIRKVFSMSLQIVTAVSSLFLIGVFTFLHPISKSMGAGYEGHPEFIAIMAIVVALDAVQGIMFTYLRFNNRAIKFVSLKLMFIIMSISLNLVAFLLLPCIHRQSPDAMPGYDPDNQAFYVFLINLICTASVTLFFIPELKIFRPTADRKLFKDMLAYSSPILLLGLTGILSQHIDKIMYPHLVPGETGQIELGIYGAVAKIAAIMLILTQAFRYAYEPIVFRLGNGKDSKEYQAHTMKYYVAITLLAFLAVMFYMDIIRQIIAPDYWVGLKVVPIIMITEIIMGVYQNLANWYKLNDETWWGAIFSGIGCVILFSIIVIFTPRYGYIACATAALIGFSTSMLLSYFVGQRRNPIPYDLKSIFRYVLLAALLYTASCLVPFENSLIRMCCNTVLISVYIFYLVKKDIPLKQIPILNRFFK